MTFRLLPFKNTEWKWNHGGSTMMPVPDVFFDSLLEHCEGIEKLKSWPDIKSCAVIKSSCLNTQDTAKNPLWVEINIITDRRHAENDGTEKEKNDEDTTDNEKGLVSTVNYLMQGLVLNPSYDCGFEGSLILVTYENYFSIMKLVDLSHLGIHAVRVKLQVAGPPKIPDATIAVFGHIETTEEEIANEDLKEILERHFKESVKYVRMNEVFSVNIKKFLPPLRFSSEHFLIEKLYFEVIDIRVKSGKNVAGNSPCYIKTGVTQIYSAPKDGFIPPQCEGLYMSPLLSSFGQKLFELFIPLFENPDVVSKNPFILLLHGPKFSGKKTAVKYVASWLGVKLLIVDCFDFVPSDDSVLISRLNELRSTIKRLAPCIVILDNVELLGRDEQNREHLKSLERLREAVSEMFNFISGKLQVVFVGVSQGKTLDLVPAVQRMFIKIMKFEAPDKKSISEFLSSSTSGVEADDDWLQQTSEKLLGYRFGDLEKLRRISLIFLREDARKYGGIDAMTMENLNKAHWDRAIEIMDGFYSDSIGSAKIPEVHWDDVGGLDDLKEEIINALKFNSKYPELVASGMRRSGILFYGPPGTGKTLMAKAVATECKYNFLSVKGPELINMYVGQSEKNIREVFSKAREASPCIIFFDELDSLAPKRDAGSGVVNRIVSQLLTEMDGLQSNDGVFTIGATNRPDLLDSALLRPGRFDKMFYVGVCKDVKSKLSVFKALTKRFSLASDVNLEYMAQNIVGCVTGADIYSICSNAWREAAKKEIKKKKNGEKVSLPVLVCNEHFVTALSDFSPSLSEEEIMKYEKFKCMEK